MATKVGGDGRLLEPLRRTCSGRGPHRQRGPRVRPPGRGRGTTPLAGCRRAKPPLEGMVPAPPAGA